jgi:hypothetical protein
MVAQAMTAEPTVVNGINVDDLFALIEGVRRDAAKGKTNWRVTTTGRLKRAAERKSRASRSAASGCGAGSPSTSTSPASLVERTGSPIRRSICWRRSTPA